MTLVISKDLVLGQLQVERNNAGIIGCQNVVTFNTISASSELALSPATNMSNPATAFGWEATSTATQTITIASSGQEIDYIGIARHNLNQDGLTVTVKFDGVTVETLSSVSDNQAILFLLSTASPTTVTVEIAGATIAPKISVVYVGKAIVLERNIYVGHTPITMGRERSTINGMSESGQYLGEVIRNQSLVTDVSLQNLTPVWYRANLDPFFSRVPRTPCFWAWRPEDYPDEVGYCWIEGNPKPSNQRSNGMMQVSWTFRGIS